ncbi:TPM domain-containing protein [Planktothrix serta]|uniref:TPM domain-containing protein n=1 Tax=Planktothrix serta TaxID=1678310 RepID=UPI0018CC4299|nr:TPM domain-containing protein [Planktothrix serta]
MTQALTVQEVPNPRHQNGGWVTDMANILRPETEAKLNQMIAELEAKNGTEIAVVTVPTTQPSPTPKDFTTQLFNTWKIGKTGQNNGVLFLNSVEDRRVEIETGYGVEGALPDARVGRIIQTRIIPYFKQKDWDGGTLAGTEALISILAQEIYPPGVSLGQKISNFTLFLVLSSGLLSYRFYQTAKRQAKQPAFIQLGTYSRIKNIDPTNAGVKKSIHIGAFATLFAINSIALSILVQTYPGWLWVGGVPIIYMIYLCTLLGRQSWVPLNQNNRLGRLFILVSGLILFGIVSYFPWVYWNSPQVSVILVTILLLYLLSLFANWQNPQNKAVTSTTFFFLVCGVVWIFWVVFLAAFLNEFLGYIWDFIGYLDKNTRALIVSGILSLIGSGYIANSLYKRFCIQGNRQSSIRPFYEETSQHRMQILEPDQVLSILTDHEKVAQELGSVEFEGWWCPDVTSVISRDTIYLRAYVLNDSEFFNCPQGNELTVTRTSQITRQATTYHSGIRLITSTCQCCNYQNQTEQIIPQESSSSSSGGGGSSSSSGGGDFGGGSSGGGGAGGDY